MTIYFIGNCFGDDDVNETAAPSSEPIEEIEEAEVLPDDDDLTQDDLEYEESEEEEEVYEEEEEEVAA